MNLRNFSLFLKSDKTLWGSGYNRYGQLGDESKIDKHSPVHINTKSDDIAEIETGNLHAFILKADNSLWGTGFNNFGALGDGTNQGKTSFELIMNNISIKELIKLNDVNDKIKFMLNKIVK